MTTATKQDREVQKGQDLDNLRQLLSTTNGGIRRSNVMKEAKRLFNMDSRIVGARLTDLGISGEIEASGPVDPKQMIRWVADRKAKAQADANAEPTLDDRVDKILLMGMPATRPALIKLVRDGLAGNDLTGEVAAREKAELELRAVERLKVLEKEERARRGKGQLWTRFGDGWPASPPEPLPASLPHTPPELFPTSDQVAVEVLKILRASAPMTFNGMVAELMRRHPALTEGFIQSVMSNLVNAKVFLDEGTLRAGPEADKIEPKPVAEVIGAAAAAQVPEVDPVWETLVFLADKDDDLKKLKKELNEKTQSVKADVKQKVADYKAALEKDHATQLKPLEVEVDELEAVIREGHDGLVSEARRIVSRIRTNEARAAIAEAKRAVAKPAKPADRPIPFATETAPPAASGSNGTPAPEAEAPRAAASETTEVLTGQPAFTGDALVLAEHSTKDPLYKEVLDRISIADIEKVVAHCRKVGRNKGRLKVLEAMLKRRQQEAGAAAASVVG